MWDCRLHYKHHLCYSLYVSYYRVSDYNSAVYSNTDKMEPNQFCIYLYSPLFLPVHNDQLFNQPLTMAIWIMYKVVWFLTNSWTRAAKSSLTWFWSSASSPSSFLSTHTSVLEAFGDRTEPGSVGIWKCWEPNDLYQSLKRLIPPHQWHVYREM